MNLQNKLEVVSLVQQQHAKQEKGNVMSILNTIENKLEILSNQVGKGGKIVVDSEECQYESDPLSLLQQGQLGPAIEAALELKSIDMIDTLLLRITEDDVIELYQSHCQGNSSGDGGYGLKLVLFCLIQQISIDLMHNEDYCTPMGLDGDLELETIDESVSGRIKYKVDWLKCLIMLVSEEENDNNNDNNDDTGVNSKSEAEAILVPINSKILSNLQGIHKKMVMSGKGKASKSKSPITTPILNRTNSSNSGSSSNSNNVGSYIMIPPHPSSASTVKRDIQMLIYVLQQQQ